MSVHAAPLALDATAATRESAALTCPGYVNPELGAKQRSLLALLAAQQRATG